jgi:hypothetical protein
LDLSTAGTTYSNPVPTDWVRLLCVAATVSGSAALNSTLTLQACLDPGTDARGSLTNWVDVASSAVTVTADGTTMWNVADLAWRWLRIKYVRTAGTGTLSVLATTKGEH